MINCHMQATLGWLKDIVPTNRKEAHRVVESALTFERKQMC